MPGYADGWYIVTAFTSVNIVGCMLIQFLACAPLSSTFILSGPRSCYTLHPGNPGQLYGTTILDISADLMIIALPFPLLFTLHIPLAKKLGLCVMFALGFLIILFSLVRATQVHAAGSGLIGNINFFWMGIWSQAEAAVAVTVASLPQLWTVYTLVKRRLRRDLALPLGLAIIPEKVEFKKRGYLTETRGGYGTGSQVELARANGLVVEERTVVVAEGRVGGREEREGVMVETEITLEFQK
jgi:hypothetical protein